MLVFQKSKTGKQDNEYQDGGHQDFDIVELDDTLVDGFRTRLLSLIKYSVEQDSEEEEVDEDES